MWKKWLLMEEKRRKTEMRPRRDYEEDPALERIYRQRAKERLRGRAAYFAPIMGVSYGSLRLSSAKTRWGSCSGKGEFKLSLEADSDAAGGSGIMWWSTSWPI